MSSNKIYMKDDDWRGILPIVSVPFQRNGAVDYDGFIRILEYVEGTTCLGMVLFGIASEFYKLSDYEKNILVKEFLDYKTKKKKIISITDHAMYLAAHKAKKYQHMGVDGLMILPPFFLHPPKEHIIEHIHTMLSSVSIPTIVQVAPNETGVSYSKDDLIALHNTFPHCILKIEGSPIPEKLIASLISESDDIKIFNGYAGIYMPQMIAIGCKGIMPGCSFLDVYIKIYDMYMSGDAVSAEKLHMSIAPYLKKWMQSCEYIINVEKYILMRKKIIKSAVCRMPSHTLQQYDYKEIEEFLEKYC